MILVSLVGFNDAFNAIRLYKRQECVQTDVLSGNHKTKSAVLLFHYFWTSFASPLKFKVSSLTGPTDWSKSKTSQYEFSLVTMCRNLCLHFNLPYISKQSIRFLIKYKNKDQEDPSSTN